MSPKQPLEKLLRQHPSRNGGVPVAVRHGIPQPRAAPLSLRRSMEEVGGGI